MKLKELMAIQTYSYTIIKDWDDTLMRYKIIWDESNSPYVYDISLDEREIECINASEQNLITIYLKRQ